MIPQALLNLIKKFEGLRLKPYLCSAGVPTIGYGSTRYPDGRKVALQDPPISEAAAEAMMMDDADGFLRATGKLSPVLWLEGDDKHSAIADFAYNLGVTRYKASTLKRRVDAGDWEGACDELAKWVRGGGRVLPGLVKRRSAEAQLLR